MNEYTIDPLQWFLERQLDFKPKHFVATNTPATKESLNWIVYNLKGRFCIFQRPNEDIDINNFNWVNTYVAFEDPNEAILFELRWS